MISNSPCIRAAGFGLVLSFLLGGVAPAAADFPYDLETGTEVGLLLTAAAAYGWGWWLDRDFRTLIPEEVDALAAQPHNFLDQRATRRWSPSAGRSSDYLVTGQLALPLGLSFTDQGSRQPTKITAMYLETMALNSGLTYLLKNAFNRTRPFVFNGHPGIPLDLKTSRHARKSFPSGHTANAFAAMVFFAGVHQELNPDSGGTDLVWAGCLTSAVVTGVLRVASGRHFATDVLAGAALGSLVGWAVPRLHEIEKPGAGPGNSSPALSFSLGFGF